MWGLAGSVRDTIMNRCILIHYNGKITESYPSKHVRIKVPLKTVTVIIKRYTSNRGVEYIEVYKPTGELVYKADYIDADEVAEVLRKLGVSNISEVLNYI